MIISKLLTKYILSSIWTKLIIFLLYYFIVRSSFFFDIDNSLVECMQRSNDIPQLPKDSISPIVSEQKEEVKEAISLTSVAEELRQLRIRDFELKEQIQNLRDRRIALLDWSRNTLAYIPMATIRDHLNLYFDANTTDTKLNEDYNYIYKKFFPQRSPHVLHALIIKHVEDIAIKENEVRTNLNRIFELETQTNMQRADEKISLFQKELQQARMEKELLHAEAKETQNTLQETIRSRKSFERKLAEKEILFQHVQNENQNLRNQMVTQQIAEAKTAQENNVLIKNLQDQIHQLNTALFVRTHAVDPLAKSQTHHFSQIENSIQESKTVLQQNQQDIKDIHSATLTGSQSPRKGPDLR
jgi:hypothetical protein